MATIADNIAELMRIRLEMKEFAKIPDDVPFEQYGAWLAWAGSDVPAQPLMADFVNKRYSMDGVPCRFEDIFEFERLSKAWLWDSSKGMIEVDINTPRIIYEGLRLEPESTNFLVDSFLSSGRSGMQVVGGDLFFGVDKVGAHIHFKQTLNNNYAYKNYQDLDAPEGSHSLTYVSDTTGLSWGTGSEVSLQTVGISGASLKEVSHGVYSRRAIMQSTGQSGRSRGFVKRPSHDTTEPKLYLYQLENCPRYTSPIKTEGVPVTRLPETLTLKNPNQSIIVDADEGIIQDKGTFTGFGHIRKIEVK